ncbi:protocatechuate 3,4-dioxygenase subunit alpha [Rhodobacteraceae bacterium CCMM004]|nr:protocatechuate 3,4-dioxygenase subunit alpha [Rhodobacteraceae bacterium CCMM004]
MAEPTTGLRETAAQTAGPYVHIGCLPAAAGLGDVYDRPLGAAPMSEGAAGTRIVVTGSIYDGTGWALRDAMLESWQADAAGLYPGQPGADPAVGGFCRFAADAETGLFRLATIKPGRVPMRGGGTQAPHIALWIVARGINIGLATRIYFDDEDNADDPLLARIEQRPRAETLIAQRTGEGTYAFDVRLQGPGETVFLDL